MRRKRSPIAAPPTIPEDLRALVPVMSAQGGSGRSTVAGLLAYALAPATATVVVDPQPRVRSPWPDWIGAEQGDGLAGLFALGREPETYEVAHAAARRQLPPELVGLDGTDEVHTYSVLTDQRPWDSRPLYAPSDPAWYAALVERGGWAFGIVDTAFTATADHIRDRHKARLSQLAGWCRRSDTVPIVVTTATGGGLAGVSQLLTALEADELSPAGIIVVVSGLIDDEAPRRLRSTLKTIEARVFAVWSIPHDRTIRANGLGVPTKIDPAALTAGRCLARSVVERAQGGVTAPTPGTPTSPVPTSPGPTSPASGGETTGEASAAAQSATPGPPTAPFGGTGIPATEFPSASMTAMSANTGWVPIRRSPDADDDEGLDTEEPPTPSA